MTSGHLSLGARLTRALYTQNPFYLIGTFLVLFGLQQSLGNEAGLVKSVLFVALLGGYTLLLAALATIIIRAGQVWDDARTILLVIVLMFFMLSTSLDVHLLYDRARGSVLLLLGLLFSVAVSEGLLRGLRIHLPAMYKGPYYLLLTLLFTYPIALARLSFEGYYTLLSWALLAFPALGAMCLLTLWPAAYASSQRPPATGTPWKWPYYPWSLFVFLTVGIGIRSWWLSVAFQWTEGQDYSFRPYFLIPLVLAWAVLVLEMGLARQSRWAIRAALLLPLLALTLAFPGEGLNPVDTQFLQQLTSTLGSPAELAIAMSVLFYGWATLRQVRGGEVLLVCVAALSTVVDAQTLSLDTFTQPRPLVLGAIALGMVASGLLLRTSWRVAIGGGMIVAATGFWWPTTNPHVAQFWAWHLPVLATLGFGVLLNDHLAQQVRNCTQSWLPLLALVASVLYPWLWMDVPDSATTMYLAGLAVASLANWLRERQQHQFVLLLMTCGACAGGPVRQVYRLLQGSLLAEGLPWLAAGLALVALAFGISLVKMGFWRHVWPWLLRVHRALGGEP